MGTFCVFTHLAPGLWLKNFVAIARKIDNFIMHIFGHSE
jgi:hypothetical protein